MTTLTHASLKRLSKSRFTSGLQCHKQLWWKAHEPDAAELVADPATEFIMDQWRAAARPAS